MNLESSINPNDLQPPPRVTGSLILIHAISGLCCGVIGITQALQPDLIASVAVPGYEGPSVPQSIKIAGFISMAPLRTAGESASAISRERGYTTNKLTATVQR